MVRIVKYAQFAPCFDEYVDEDDEHTFAVVSVKTETTTFTFEIPKGEPSEFLLSYCPLLIQLMDEYATLQTALSSIKCISEDEYSKLTIVEISEAYLDDSTFDRFESCEITPLMRAFASNYAPAYVKRVLPDILLHYEIDCVANKLKIDYDFETRPTRTIYETTITSDTLQALVDVEVPKFSRSRKYD